MRYYVTTSKFATPANVCDTIDDAYLWLKEWSNRHPEYSWYVIDIYDKSVMYSMAASK